MLCAIKLMSVLHNRVDGLDQGSVKLGARGGVSETRIVGGSMAGSRPYGEHETR